MAEINPTDKRLELILEVAYNELCKLPNTDRVKKAKRKVMDALKLKETGGKNKWNCTKREWKTNL